MRGTTEIKQVNGLYIYFIGNWLTKNKNNSVTVSWFLIYEFEAFFF